MKFGDKLRQVRKEKKITQQQLSKAVGLSRPSIAQYENNVYEPNIDTIKLFAKYLNIDVAELLDGEAHSVKKVPVRGTASCGSPDTNHAQDGLRPVYYHGRSWHKDLYAVVASGDSMAPDIEDGDEVICDPNIEPQNGDMVHYTIHDESAIKIFVKDDEAHILQFVPYNQTEKFKTRSLRLDDEESMAYLTIAKVVAVNKLKFNNRLARLKMIGRA